MDALHEEQLSAIEGADTGQIVLIQQRFTNRAVGLSTDPPDSLVEVPIGAEEVWAKMSDNRVLISGRNQFHDGEPVADYVMYGSATSPTYGLSRRHPSFAAMLCRGGWTSLLILLGEAARLWLPTWRSSWPR